MVSKAEGQGWDRSKHFAGKREFVSWVRSSFLRLFCLVQNEGFLLGFCSQHPVDWMFLTVLLGLVKKKKKKKITALNFPENLRLRLPCFLSGPLL